MDVPTAALTPFDSPPIGPMLRDKYQIARVTGLLLLLMGMQLRVVETFIVTPAATQTLAHWFGPSSSSVEGVVQQFVLDTASPRKAITPPRWLGFACLAAGFITLAFGLLRRRKR